MKELSYADRHVITADEIADEVIQYAKVLASAHAADTVRMPGIGPDGSVHTVEFLLGPSSQITSVDVEDRPVTLPVSETVAAIRARVRAHLPAATLDGDPADSPAFDPDYL